MDQSRAFLGSVPAVFSLFWLGTRVAGGDAISLTPLVGLLFLGAALYVIVGQTLAITYERRGTHRTIQ